MRIPRSLERGRLPKPVTTNRRLALETLEARNLLAAFTYNAVTGDLYAFADDPSPISGHLILLPVPPTPNSIHPDAVLLNGAVQWFGLDVFDGVLATFDTDLDVGDFPMVTYASDAGNADFAVTLACDFNFDDVCDVDDLDLLYPELGGTTGLFNLDRVGSVDNDDLTMWLDLASRSDPLGRTFVRGDANLDGSVLGDDFTTLAFNFGGTGGWGQGNFVVDPAPGGGSIGGADFTELAFRFGFSSPLRANAIGTGDDDRNDRNDRISGRLEARTVATEFSYGLPDRPAEARIAEQPLEKWSLI